MTQHQALQMKMKTCVMYSHTLPLSNGISSSIIKSLYTREIKIFKIPRVQNFQIFVDCFIEESRHSIKQGCKWIREE